MNNQYQPLSNNPIRESQFVQGQKPYPDNYLENSDSAVTINYGLSARESKPLYGSNFVVNGFTQPNSEVQPQELYTPNQNFAPQNLPYGQVFNSKPELINNNKNYPGSIQQQIPTRQNFNNNGPTKPVQINTNYPGSIQQQAPIQQNPHKTNINGYGQEIIPGVSSQSNFEGPHFFPDQNNYGASINHDDYPKTQDTYVNGQRQDNLQKNKIRFPFVKETPPNLPNYNGYQKPVSSSTPNINPNSWMKEQLKRKQGTSKNYPNGNTNEQPEYEEYQPPNNYFNKPASNFDLNNGQQVEYSKQTHILNSYDPSQIHFENGQQSSIPNGQNYNSNSSPSYSDPSKFDQHSQNLYPTSQDKQFYEDSKLNNQFQIVVPEITRPSNDKELPSQPSLYLPNTNPSKELNINRGSSNWKSTYNQQYPIKNENTASTQNPSYNSQSISQEHPVYSPSTTSKCPNGFNGIKPHPTDCSKFLSCANGRTFEMDCGPGTLFNPTSSVCDHPYNVECNRIDPTITTTENYIPSINVKLQTDHDTSSSDLVTETEPFESQNQAVLETLPSENKQSKVLRNPTSIDLPDNFLPNSSIVHTPTKIINNKLENNVPVKIDLKPNSTQSIRLRGGPKYSEGFLQVQEKPFQWGVVCDEPSSWTIDKADIVCKQLGFKRFVIIILIVVFLKLLTF